MHLKKTTGHNVYHHIFPTLATLHWLPGHFCIDFKVLEIRHPSVSKDYGNVLCIEDLEQHLVWLRRPIRE